MLPEEQVLIYFSGDYNCAQAVLLTVLESEGLSFKEAPLVAAAFGGGIIGRGEVCGAVSGALMAIGVLNGQLYTDIVEVKKATKEDCETFYQRFEQSFGHNTCNGLIGVDRNDPDALQKAIDEGRYRDNCPKYVVEAVKIVLDIFKER